MIVTPIYGPSREHLGFAKVTRDLTEQRRAEERQRAEQSRLRSLIDQSLTGIAAFQDGRYVHVNP